MRRGFLTATIAAVAALALPAWAAAQTTPYATLAPGFTQSLYATGYPFAMGVAFAPDGDPLGAFGSLFRADAQTTVTTHGSTVHPVTTFASGALGIGLANSADGGVYTNTSAGVRKINPADGSVIASGGPAGNSLGIALDPQSGDLYYFTANGNIERIKPDLTGATVVGPGSGDGMAFSADGKFIFVAENGVDVYTRNGTFVQHIAHTAGLCCADGMAFHASPPRFVVSVDTSGNMTRYDFPNDDYTQAPTQSLLASGGGRGDLGQVGSDGCLYLSMQGTTFADGTTDPNQGSLVKVCGGFNPPVPVTTKLTLNPALATVVPGLAVYIKSSGRLTTAGGTPIPNETVSFTAGGKPICSAKTDAQGNVACGGTVDWLLATVLALGYDGKFAGDGALQPTSAHAPLVTVLGIKLL